MLIFKRCLTIAGLFAALQACLPDDPAGVASDVPPNTTDLRVSLPKPEFGYQISSTTHIVKAGTEEHFCDVVKLEPIADEKLVWIHSFESRTSAYTHHMNVHVGPYSVMDAFVVKGSGESLLGVKAGAHRCDELGDLMEKGSFPVYPSQRSHQAATLPTGVAVPGIAPLLMVMEHHYINTTDKDAMVNAVVNFHRMPEDQVQYVLTGFYGGGSPIDIPPNSSKITAWTCAIANDVTMVAISSHSHVRGDCFTLNEYNRDTSAIEETPLFVNDHWDAPPIQFYDPGEWIMRKGDGIHWACHYRNPENREVVEGGSASDEMCIFVGVGFPSRISVQDIKDMVADPLSVDIDSVVNDALIACDPVTDAVSPWPHANEPVEKFDDACGGFAPTADKPREGD